MRKGLPGWAEATLEAIAAGVPVLRAAQAAGAHGPAVHQLAQCDEDFADRLAAAQAGVYEPPPPPLPLPCLPLSLDQGADGAVALLVDTIRVAWADAAAGDVDAQAWLAELVGRPLGEAEASAYVAAALGVERAPAEPWHWWAPIALAELRAGSSREDAAAVVGLGRGSIGSFASRRPSFAAAIAPYKELTGGRTRGSRLP